MLFRWVNSTIKGVTPSEEHTYPSDAIKDICSKYMDTVLGPVRQWDSPTCQYITSVRLKLNRASALAISDSSHVPFQEQKYAHAECKDWADKILGSVVSDLTSLQVSSIFFLAVPRYHSVLTLFFVMRAAARYPLASTDHCN